MDDLKVENPLPSSKGAGRMRVAFWYFIDLRGTHLSVKPKFFTLTSILSLREGEEVTTLIQNDFT
jgi:hypothetical protein